MAKSDLDCWKDLQRTSIAKRLPFRWGDVKKMIDPTRDEPVQDLDALLQDQVAYLNELTTRLKYADIGQPVVISTDLARQRRSAVDAKIEELLTRGDVDAPPPTPTPQK